MKKTIILAFLLLAITALDIAAAKERGFAIFIDSTSYQKAHEEVTQYAQSIERQGLKVFVIEDKWGIPDSIRATIARLHAQKNYPIEGAVFIGDIPIPMLRDAQHLTTAFKMSQQIKNWQRSSVPSDRYYDDLHLRFTFLKRDEKNPGLFYYSLNADSPQRLEPTIYSGRIKPGDTETESKNDRLKADLKKEVRVKAEQNAVDRLFYFSGQGYNSESQLARIGEKESNYEYFPWLKRQQNGIQYMNHLRDDFIKYRLMAEMQHNDLDIAVLHHHGAPGKEYLNRMPVPNNATEDLESAKSYFRSKIRAGVDEKNPVDSVIAAYCKKYDIPADWFSDVLSKESIERDSIRDYQLDLHIGDFAGYHPNARVVILDACFNGAFNHDRYIAGEYIFNSGNTVAVIANSVNVLQDKWADRNIGLLGFGMRVGYFPMYNPYLESHVIGDPTFAFSSQDSSIDINTELGAYNVSYWKEQLKSPYPAMQLMAIQQIAKKGNCSNLLFDTFKSSPDYIVRLGCMMELSRYDDDNFINCLHLDSAASYEQIQRFATVLMGKSGDPRLIPSIIRLLLNNNNGKRVDFQLKAALSLFETEPLLAEFEKQFAACTIYPDKEKKKKLIERFIRSTTGKWKEYTDVFSNRESKPKDILFCIRSLRNNPLHAEVPLLLNFFRTCNNEEYQQLLAEAFGWFNLSYKSPELLQALKEISLDNRYPESVRTEALKSINRITHLRQTGK